MSNRSFPKGQSGMALETFKNKLFSEAANDKLNVTDSPTVDGSISQIPSCTPYVFLFRDARNVIDGQERTKFAFTLTQRTLN